MTVTLLRTGFAAAPLHFTQFIAEMQAAVEARGVEWNIPLEPSGKPVKGSDWDLRKLNGSHDRHSHGTGGFVVDAEVKGLALAAGRPLARLPEDGVLSTDVQEFIKALIASHCLCGRTADSAQILARAARRLFSGTRHAPWEICREDFEGVMSLKTWSKKAEQDFKTVAKVFDERLLSHGCPVEPTVGSASPTPLLAKLTDRVAGEKLPEKSALLELVRIVFQETPQFFNDAVLFGALRLVVLTGLRITEVVTLPADCLVWDEHLDVVTGKSAGAAGGVSRTLRLRYYGEKQRGGAPDLLVERYQHVPADFEMLVEATVKEIVALTQPLRDVLEVQAETKELYPLSDIRTFKTSSGQSAGTWNRLFLTLGVQSAYPLAGSLTEATRVSTPFVNRIYGALGRVRSAANPQSFFKRYGATPEAQEFSLKPHSLRHLMNTELFRADVPDTAITHQFGRMTVAQSYEYDHRSLAEKLKFVQLPAAAAVAVRAGSTQELVAKMVVSGVAASSHLGQSFKRIQAEHGDGAAFSYLAANSDGFHVTPYGFCTNSFSVNPCARHLKCFDNCKHFAASGLAEHKISLSDLRAKLVAMRSAAQAKPANTVGRKNQIAHAERLISGVDAALLAQPNTNVFEAGVDHTDQSKDVFT